MEKLKEKNYEVILLTDAVDEWLTQSLPVFKDKKLVSITKELLDLDTVEEKILKLQERKSALSQNLITTEDSFIKSLSEEDIKAIFD